MKIAEKIAKGEATVEEVTYLLWHALVQCEPYVKHIDTDEDEGFCVSDLVDSIQDRWHNE